MRRIEICCNQMKSLEKNGDYHTIKYQEWNHAVNVMGCDCEAIEDIKYCPYCGKQIKVIDI